MTELCEDNTIKHIFTFEWNQIDYTCSILFNTLTRVLSFYVKEFNNIYNVWLYNSKILYDMEIEDNLFELGNQELFYKLEIKIKNHIKGKYVEKNNYKNI